MTTTTGPQALATMRVTRAHHLCDMAWQHLAAGEQDQCRTYARRAMRHTHLLAKHLRRAHFYSSPPPAWTSAAKQGLMLLRTELAELHAHYIHPTSWPAPPDKGTTEAPVQVRGFPAPDCVVQ